MLVVVGDETIVNARRFCGWLEMYNHARVLGIAYRHWRFHPSFALHGTPPSLAADSDFDSHSLILILILGPRQVSRTTTSPTRPQLLVRRLPQLQAQSLRVRAQTRNAPRATRHLTPLYHRPPPRQSPPAIPLLPSLRHDTTPINGSLRASSSSTKHNCGTGC